ncbi:hypothetical protein Cgig2_021870 [Carnegiea gigantea]|uniref:Dof-type domain-containing protein n=1 Tax=Carnegiea gigantea TaxID=171969 RepID=A0A9Q1JU11_9CARY|nr:hypothetical protein Cgig2_021870 [Carnegiea gigantea]
MSREDITMAVAKDPAIKLFGRTISVPDAQTSDDAESLDNGSSLMTKAETEDCKIENLGVTDEVASLKSSKGGELQASRQQPISQDITSKLKGHEESHCDGEPKPSFKRPDKILPCPRCSSSDTKFCYFNNYNVNQPRHFCKSCQRYWTAGGTVRNVPVGAGRRRNKHMASQYRQIIASSDGGPASLVGTPDSANHPLLEESSSSCTGSSPNEMVLKFGPESPHCDSTRNLLSQGQKNGCHEKASLPCGSPLTASYGVNNDVPLQRSLSHYAVPHQISPLRPSLNNGVPLAVPGCSASNISLQFVPASYWSCIPVWVAGSGNISLALSNGCASRPFCSSDNGLPVLGKHPRDTSTLNEEVVEKGFCAPKTLRIHDLDKA